MKKFNAMFDEQQIIYFAEASPNQALAKSLARRLGYAVTLIPVGRGEYEAQWFDATQEVWKVAKVVTQ